ncbi:MAG: hypothetical protein QM747_13140 [Nocardioides sp.]
MSAQRDRVLIFDTTLRDGEQSPGCSMAQPEKLRVARALADLGVDVIEAGFPAASRGDWESVNAVAREVQGPIICGLARCNRDDITLVSKAIAPAAKKRIHVFLATSAIHRQYKLRHGARGDHPHRRGRREDRARALRGRRVLARRRLAHRARFPHAGGRGRHRGRRHHRQHSRTPWATRVPDEFAELFRYLRKNVRGIDKVRLSVHCHDDLGMAVANSLTAVVAGARQIECTINGIGERAGNCSLEEVVMALKTRDAFFNLDTKHRHHAPLPTSRMLANIVGMPIPRNKAIVGENAFTHESGIHQHGMLEASIRPTRSCGRRTSACRAPTLVLGKHSGAPCAARAHQGAGLRARRRRVRARVRPIQGARRQEEGTLRR